MNDLFPIEPTVKPALELARERLDAALLEYDVAWRAMEDYGDPPPPKAMVDEINAAREALAVLELAELNRRKDG